VFESAADPTMDEAEQIRQVRRASQRRMERAFGITFVFVAALWWIQLVQTVAGWDFARLGVEPHHLFGLVGVAAAPLIHASWQHLLANTLPVLILGTALLYGYPHASRIAVSVIWLGTGLGVWFTGRPAFHVGASGLVMGFITFMLVAGALRRDRASVAITAAVVFLYGSALIGIVPNGDPEISYESHAWGAAIGVLCAFALFRLDPPPPRRRYSWEFEPEDSEDPLIGDLWRYPPPGPGSDVERPRPPAPRPNPRQAVAGIRQEETPPRLH